MTVQVAIIILIIIIKIEKQIILQEYKEGVSKRSVKLEYRPKQEQNNNPLFMHADGGRISQVVSNLLSNAIKFTQGNIVVSTEINGKGDNKNAIVSVIDNGAGMDSEILSKLFTKFASKSFQGTGLGLFISKSIVEAHGGRIWAENNSDGKGATFTFTLPLSLAH
jgi:signal transduction histidine kinase